MATPISELEIALQDPILIEALASKIGELVNNSRSTEQESLFEILKRFDALEGLKVTIDIQLKSNQQCDPSVQPEFGKLLTLRKCFSTTGGMYFC